MILFSGVDALLFEGEKAAVARDLQVTVADGRILSISQERPEGPFERIIDGKHRLMMPGLYNSHCHIAMSLLRGHAEGLPLDRWLSERIFPAEDRLDEAAVYAGSQLGIAEMLASGTVAFSDMYFFTEGTIRAVLDSGIKANLAKTLVCFDEAGLEDGGRMAEAIALHKAHHQGADGQLKLDIALHAIYSTGKPYLARAAEAFCGLDVLLQYHISETKKEQEDCFAQYGKTPTELFCESGLFAYPGVAAHGVYLSDGDRALLARHGIILSHNPSSNLKLGSGIADIKAALEAGVLVALGTDGCASNNNLNLFEEMHIAALLQKGLHCDPTVISAAQSLQMATQNGARAQGRAGCGMIAQGMRADLILIDTDKPHLCPGTDPVHDLVYSAQGADVALTMVDGRVLYENGLYHTLDIERVQFEAKVAAKQVCGAV